MSAMETNGEAWSRLLNPRVREAAWAIWRIVKRIVSLAAALGLTVSGGAVGIWAALQVRLPDPALLKMAKNLRAMTPPPSAAEMRDLYLQMLGAGVVVLIWGVLWLREWSGPLLRDRE